MSKKGPYLLIGSLILIVFFISGLQYGKQVERANKVITTILSISPTIVEKSQKITYLRFEHSQCGISFVYPSLIANVKQSTTSAALENKETKEKISLDCNPVITNVNDLNGATKSANIAGRDVTIKNLMNSKMITFILTHPRTGKKILFELNNELLPLIEETLVFL